MTRGGGRIHPAAREMLPDDPLALHGFEVPGDPAFMLEVLVEEYARLGSGLDDLMRLARNPFYRALHGLYRCYGEDGLRARIAAVLERVGVTRVRMVQERKVGHGEG